MSNETFCVLFVIFFENPIVISQVRMLALKGHSYRLLVNVFLTVLKAQISLLSVAPILLVQSCVARICFDPVTGTCEELVAGSCSVPGVAVTHVTCDTA